MADVREKVLRLIELAVGTANEHEARNAAVVACKLIKQHGLLEVEVKEIDFFSPPPPSSARTRRKVRPVAPPIQAPVYDKEEWDLVTEKLRDWMKEAAPPPLPHVPGATKRRVPRDAEKKDIPITMPAWCAGCGQALRRGSYGTWSRGEIWHSTCYATATEG